MTLSAIGFPPAPWSRACARPLSLSARDSRYPNREFYPNLTMLRTLFRRLAARLRGDPPPVSDVDVRRARQMLESATAEDQARGREAAQRAIKAARGAPGGTRGTDPAQP